jgi:hypothetical protein
VVVGKEGAMPLKTGLAAQTTVANPLAILILKEMEGASNSSAYVGRFVEIYLDDIVVHSDDLDEHVNLVREIVLRREESYLRLPISNLVPTSPDLLRGFLGSIGYLAEGFLSVTDLRRGQLTQTRT